MFDYCALGHNVMRFLGPVHTRIIFPEHFGIMKKSHLDYCGCRGGSWEGNRGCQPKWP